MRRLPSLFAVVVSLAGCHLEVLPAQGTLEDLSLPLLPTPGLKVAVAGTIGSRSAIVQFDPGNSLSYTTRGCFESRPRNGRVTVADPFGPDETYVTTLVSGLELGPVRLKGFDAGIADGPGCVIVLGDDVLRGLALEVQVGARTVTIKRSASQEAWLATIPPGDEVQVVTLTRDPKHDWPLLAVRATQGKTSFTGSLLFSARELRTRVYEESAREAGLLPGVELLQGLPLPEGLSLPKTLEALRGFAVDRVELAPGFGVSSTIVELEPGAAPHGVQGVLGADIWGRFNVIIDTAAGLLVLHRPRVLASGARAQCERGGQVTEEACYEFVQRKSAQGFVAGMVAWRSLPEGAHVVFDLVGGATAPCRVGFTFSKADRGRSTFHELPWDRLREVMPTCAAALSQATSIEPGFIEESPLPGCPGTCAFAQDLATNRLTCECQATHPTLDENAEKDLLELYRKLVDEKKAPRETEPSDPEP